MEYNDAKDGKQKASGDLPPTAAKTQATKKQSKTASSAKKSTKQKKWSLWRHWKSASRARQAKWILEGFGVIIAAAILGIYIVGIIQNEWHFRFEHRGRVVLSRPPELLGPIECDVEKATLHMPKIRSWFKASGSQIKSAYAIDWPATIVPDEKTGNPRIDTPFPLTTDSLCQMPHIPNYGFPMNPGEELATDESASDQGFPVDFDASGKATLSSGWNRLAKDASVQLYIPVCVFYTEENSRNHTACNFYRLSLGPDIFSFQSGRSVSGKLLLYASGSCAN